MTRHGLPCSAISCIVFMIPLLKHVPLPTCNGSLRIGMGSGNRSFFVVSLGQGYVYISVYSGVRLSTMPSTRVNFRALASSALWAAREPLSRRRHPSQ